MWLLGREGKKVLSPGTRGTLGYGASLHTVVVTWIFGLEGQDWIGSFLTNGHHHNPSHLSSAYYFLGAFTCIISLHTFLVLGAGAAFSFSLF